MPETVFCLMGPTASGKTALACELAARFPFEIVSVDSALVYREMDIGTAKPEPALLAQFPHHLINIINPDSVYSAAAFCEDAKKVCGEIFARGHYPLFTGGTMLYFRAFQEGLSELPPSDALLRATLTREAQTKGLVHMHERLKALDPVSGERIHPHDTQRILRALEVCLLSGRPFSAMHATAGPQHTYRSVNLVLLPKMRDWLHARIGQRFTEMLEAGFIEEVKSLCARWDLDAESASMRTVGYRQVFEHLAGRLEAHLLAQKGIEATRQLAKRQMTWLRAWPDAHVFAPDDPEHVREVMAFSAEILDNSG